MPFPVIPDLLKNANWQKEKGKFAKLFGRKTGVGEQMNKLKAEADKRDFTKLNAANTYATMEEANGALGLCKAEFAKCEPLRKEAYALRDIAKKTGEEFKKNKLIPSSTTALLNNIAHAADIFGLTVKQYDPTAEFAAAVDRTQKNIERLDNQAKMAINASYPKCINELNKVKTTKPLVWTNEAWQGVRAYAAAVAKWKKLVALQPEWKTLSSLGMDKVTDVLKHVAALEKLLAKTQVVVNS